MSKPEIKEEELGLEIIQHLLDSAYEEAVYETPFIPDFMHAESAIDDRGKSMNMAFLPKIKLPVQETAIQLAEDYRKKYPNEPEKQVEALIQWQIAKSAGLGIVEGVGAVILVGPKLQEFFDVQTKMVKAIAYLRGYDLESEIIKTRIDMCLTGDKLSDLLKELGKEVDSDNIKKLLEIITTEMLPKIKKLINSKLFNKLNLLVKIAGKNVIITTAIVSGLVQGGVDAYWTKSIAEAAKDAFPLKGDTPVK